MKFNWQMKMYQAPGMLAEMFGVSDLIPWFAPEEKG